MKALIQRVLKAAVKVNGETVGSISRGLAVLVGIADGDFEKDVSYITDKIINLRIFSDENGKFNLSVIDIRGQILLVSQFTLLADIRKGKRPSFINAASPEKAEKLFNMLVKAVAEKGIYTQTGRFRQHMLVEILNDGPVTIILDSKDKIIKQQVRPH